MTLHHITLNGTLNFFLQSFFLSIKINVKTRLRKKQVILVTSKLGLKTQLLRQAKRAKNAGYWDSGN